MKKMKRNLLGVFLLIGVVGILIFVLQGEPMQGVDQVNMPNEEILTEKVDQTLINAILVELKNTPGVEVYTDIDEYREVSNTQNSFSNISRNYEETITYAQACQLEDGRIEAMINAEDATIDLLLRQPYKADTTIVAYGYNGAQNVRDEEIQFYTFDCSSQQLNTLPQTFVSETPGRTIVFYTDTDDTYVIGIHDHEGVPVEGALMDRVTGEIYTDPDAGGLSGKWSTSGWGEVTPHTRLLSEFKNSVVALSGIESRAFNELLTGSPSITPYFSTTETPGVLTVTIPLYFKGDSIATKQYELDYTMFDSSFWEDIVDQYDVLSYVSAEEMPEGERDAFTYFANMMNSEPDNYKPSVYNEERTIENNNMPTLSLEEACAFEDGLIYGVDSEELRGMRSHFPDLKEGGVLYIPRVGPAIYDTVNDEREVITYAVDCTDLTVSVLWKNIYGFPRVGVRFTDARGKYFVGNTGVLESHGWSGVGLISKETGELLIDADGDRIDPTQKNTTYNALLSGILPGAETFLQPNISPYSRFITGGVNDDGMLPVMGVYLLPGGGAIVYEDGYDYNEYIDTEEVARSNTCGGYDLFADYEWMPSFDKQLSVAEGIIYSSSEFLTGCLLADDETFVMIEDDNGLQHGSLVKYTISDDILEIVGNGYFETLKYNNSEKHFEITGSGGPGSVRYNPSVGPDNRNDYSYSLESGIFTLE